MKILVLHPGALGDIILSLPALGILRGHFPGAGITLAANAEVSAAVASGYADSSISLSIIPLCRLHGPTPPSPADFEFFHAYDRILSWTGASDGIFRRRLTVGHPCALVTGWKPVPGESRHVARLFIDSLKPWIEVPDAIPAAPIRVEEDDRRAGARWLSERGWKASRTTVAVQPGAGSPAKRWPLPRFRAVVQALSSRATVLILEGPAEPGLGDELARGLGSGIYVVRDLPLRLLSGVLAPCSVFLGNDSGIAHLAAGLGLACVVLFGPTRPEHWAPLGPDVSVLRGEGECPACRKLPGASHVCLDSIAVDAVLGKLSTHKIP